MVTGESYAQDTNARDRERSDQHHPEREGDFLSKTAVKTHVLLMVHRMDDRAGAEDQQRFEEGVREQVEHGRAVGAHPRREEHVAELRAGRISDDALDVVLRRADRGREESRRSTDESYDT